MPTRLVHVVVDAADPAALARWWAEALDWAITVEEPDEVAVEPPGPDGVGVPLVIVPVADPKAAKNRVHLDLRSADADDQAALVARLTGLGARLADIGQGDVPWVVLADPEGNELCVLSPREDWMRHVSEIDAGELVLRPVGREVAAALLEGRVPAGVVLAPGYPSRFSLETLQMVVDADGDGDGFGPYFMVRKADGAVVGEIGAGYHRATATAQVGYTVVEPSWGHGYATAALRALLAHLLADRRVRRVVAETLEEHTASRRVMEKAGMRYHHARTGEVDGTTVALVVYEARPAEALPADG